MATPINILFTVGTLEPGLQYTPQQFAEAIAEILLGEIQQDTLMPGVSGPTAPSQDKGLWTNTATSPHTLWVWSPSTGSYVQEDSQTPVGAIIFWPGASAIPSNFRACNGAALNKSQFPRCYAALGGSGSPYDQTSLTFNLPDATRRTLFGSGGEWSIGQHVGAETMELVIGHIPDHVHTIPTRRQNADGAAGITTGDLSANDTRQTGATGSGSEKGNPFSLIPPGLVGQWIIRVS